MIKTCTLLCPLIVFLIISFLLCFKIIHFPNIVIGDNFHWTQNTLNDILGPRVIRETYMGDIAVLSTFKTGFILPISLLFDFINLPISLLYPFLFYFFSMVSFYFLAKEFFTNRFIIILLSVLYVVNPITPYYYASLLNAFPLVFLPLGMKFFIKTIRDVESSRYSKFFKNFSYTAFFLALCVSAHEQFFLSISLLVTFIIGSFLIFWFQKFGFSFFSIKQLLVNLVVFVLSFIIVNLSLVISIINIQSAQLSSYFTGNFFTFLQNVRFTYSTANIHNLLRQGGDAGVGLGNTAWYDINLLSNIFGYIFFAVFVFSIFLLVQNRHKIKKTEKMFFLMNIFLYFTIIGLIFFVRGLTLNLDLANSVFNFLLQTWESPIKLRIFLLLSALISSFILFIRIEKIGNTLKKKIVKSSLLIIIISSTIIYNGPWLLNYFGRTPIAQVSENLEWGELYDSKLAQITDKLEEEYSDARGVIIPYTHKVELYSPSNFRIFQLVSVLNDQLSVFTQSSSVPWSELLGLLSVRYVIVRRDFVSSKDLIFPLMPEQKIVNSLDEIVQNEDFSLLEMNDDYVILENQKALPQLYATNHFVFYDDPYTLKYSMPSVDFETLPVFIKCSNETGKLNLPLYIDKGEFNITAFVPPYNNENSHLSVSLIRDGMEFPLNLSQNQNSDVPISFSSIETLEPGDVIKDPNSNVWIQEKQISTLTLNSATQDLGNYGSFMLNFSVQVLSKGTESFHSPRIILDSGEEEYFIILHNDGNVEISLLSDGIYTSGLINKYLGFNLENQDNYINASVSRSFSKIQVYINNELAATFPTGDKRVDVTLSAEQSISRFEDINLRSRSLLRLTAAREIENYSNYVIQYQNPEMAALNIENTKSEFIVVSQYLKTQLSQLENIDFIDDFEVNLFFKGWIVKNVDQNSNEVLVEIKTAGSNITIGLAIFSITLTYLIFIITILPFLSNFYYRLRKFYEKVNRTNE